MPPTKADLAYERQRRWYRRAALPRPETSRVSSDRTTMSDIVDAVFFLLENRAVNGGDLIVDGGWHCR